MSGALNAPTSKTAVKITVVHSSWSQNAAMDLPSTTKRVARKMPSPGMSLEQWFTRANRGTDGSMVWDVLYDWKDAEAKLLSRMKELEGEYHKLQTVAEAIRELERVKTETLMCNQCIVGEVRGRGRCPDHGKRIYRAEVRLNQSLATLDSEEKEKEEVSNE